MNYSRLACTAEERLLHQIHDQACFAVRAPTPRRSKCPHLLLTKKTTHEGKMSCNHVFSLCVSQCALRCVAVRVAVCFNSRANSAAFEVSTHPTNKKNTHKEDPY